MENSDESTADSLHVKDKEIHFTTHPGPISVYIQN